MKVINLQGMTFAERLKFLEEISQDIYNHLYDDYIWSYKGNWLSENTSYLFSNLAQYTDEVDSVKSGQIVYFAGNGYLAIINQVNREAGTFTVYYEFELKGDKGDKGDIGETGKSALMYAGDEYVDKVPSVNTEISLRKSDFNRPPESNDSIIVQLVASSSSSLGKRYWICSALYKEDDGDFVLFTVKSVYEITLPAETPKYMHCITVADIGVYITFSFINKVSSPYTVFGQIGSYINSLRFVSATKMLPASGGMFTAGKVDKKSAGVYAESGGATYVYFSDGTNMNLNSKIFTDTVYQI